MLWADLNRFVFPFTCHPGQIKCAPGLMSPTALTLSAAAAGVDLARLLWIRCGVSEQSPTQVSSQFMLPGKYLAPRIPKKGLHGGGFGPHPRTEISGLSDAIEELLQPSLQLRCPEGLSHKQQPQQKSFAPRIHADHCEPEDYQTIRTVEPHRTSSVQHRPDPAIRRI